MFQTTAEAKEESLDLVKLDKYPLLQESITDCFKAVLLLWFLNVTCCACLYMAFSNMVT